VLGAALEPAERFQLVDEAGRLLAIGHAEAGRVVYDRVFGGPLDSPGGGAAGDSLDSPGGDPDPAANA
jgi:hypothetical protein